MSCLQFAIIDVESTISRQRSQTVDDLDHIRADLWPVQDSDVRGEGHTAHLLKQYEICVEMADRISQRRGAANTFFLTFNTAIVGALAGFSKNVEPAAMVALFLAAGALCVVWALLLRSYRLLNRAKFKVIGLLEERLPASPFHRAEWQALGKGEDLRKYISLTPIETVVPALFILIYLYLAFLMLS